MADLMAVDVVTPEQTLVTGPAARVALRTSDGSMTVLPGHAPFVGYVLPGPVTVESPDGVETHLAVHGGFLQIDTSRDAAAGVEGVGDGPIAGLSTKVTLLIGIAERFEDIDLARAEAARDGAIARLEQLRSAKRDESGTVVADQEIQELEEALARAELRLSRVGGPTT
jgi:F-type H+-transporting ATPase subunit epsilon